MVKSQNLKKKAENCTTVELKEEYYILVIICRIDNASGIHKLTAISYSHFTSRLNINLETHFIAKDKCSASKQTLSFCSNNFACVIVN